MTAKEKFEEALSMSLLMDEWNSIGKVGRVAVAEPNEIILFVHESEKDKYTEIHYPSFDELRKNDKFVRRVADEYLDDKLRSLVDNPDDDEWTFKLNLAAWLRDGEGECPLHPADVYFAADGMETFYTDFKDDPTLIAYVAPKFLDGSPWTRCNSYEELEEYFGMGALDNDPKHPKWWLVGRFSDGNLWMNNEEGCCYLESNNNLNLYYARKF